MNRFPLVDGGSVQIDRSKVVAIEPRSPSECMIRLETGASYLVLSTEAALLGLWNGLRAVAGDQAAMASDQAKEMVIDPGFDPKPPRPESIRTSLSGYFREKGWFKANAPS